MTVSLDLSVVLDALLERGPWVECAEILTLCAGEELRVCIPSHGITTIYYLLRSRYRAVDCDEALDRLLRILELTPVDKPILLRARSLGFNDYEDAVVAASAEASTSDYIITSNIKDFLNSRIPALTSLDFLQLLRES